MCNQNEWIVREAFLAYQRGDVARMMDFVDQDLEWTYLDPGQDDPAAADLPWPRGTGEGTAPTGGPGAARRTGSSRRRR